MWYEILYFWDFFLEWSREEWLAFCDEDGCERREWILVLLEGMDGSMYFSLIF